MGVMFDTSILVGLERGGLEPDRLTRGREQEPFGITTVTAAELLHGVHRADSPKRQM